MKKVDWNRTRGLVALAVLLGVIGFGGYAASMAQEPTPAKEADSKKEGAAEKTPCPCKSQKPKEETFAVACVCPKFLYMTMDVGDGNLAYFYYAWFHENPTEGDCGYWLPSSMVFFQTDPGAGNACCVEPCESVGARLESVLVSRKKPLKISDRVPHDRRPVITRIEGSPAARIVDDYYVSFIRADKNERIWAHVFICKVKHPQDSWQHPASFEAIAFECTTPPERAEKYTLDTKVRAKDGGNRYELKHGAMTLSVLTTDLPMTR
jgi:hypothetical protein